MAIKRFDQVTQDRLQAVLSGLQAPSFAYRSLFPDKFTSSLSWESLEADGKMTVSADVIAHDASAKLKARPDTKLQTGSIEKIGILHSIGEKALHDLYMLNANPRGLEPQIFNIIFGDIARSYNGVHMRMEQMAMQGLSTGIIDVNMSNNIGIKTKATFKIPAANKSGVAVTWSTAATATPLVDLKRVVKQAKAAGNPIVKILMEEDVFDQMRNTTEVKEQYNGLIGLSVGAVTPNIEQINVILRQNLLPPIQIIDTTISREAADGSVVTESPWSSGKVTFLSSQNAGETQFTLSAEQKMPGYSDPSVLASNRDIVRITRWSKTNPFAVFTKGESVAFPVLNNVKGIYLLNTDNVSTWS